MLKNIQQFWWNFVVTNRFARTSLTLIEILWHSTHKFVRQWIKIKPAVPFMSTVILKYDFINRYTPTLWPNCIIYSLKFAIYLLHEMSDYIFLVFMCKANKNNFRSTQVQVQPNQLVQLLYTKETIYGWGVQLLAIQNLMWNGAERILEQ